MFVFADKTLAILGSKIRSWKFARWTTYPTDLDNGSNGSRRENTWSSADVYEGRPSNRIMIRSPYSTSFLIPDP
jgi:hypothetical protein